jgi:hypothetical protein
MKKRQFLLSIFLVAILSLNAQDVPLVYNVENTGAECTPPPLPDFADLPIVRPLTDPFEWSDGSGRDITLASWSCRRNEIKLEIENYEIGPKPVRPDTINATYLDGLLTIEIIENGDTLILTSQISLPEGEGPFPAVLGMGGGTGSLPASVFDSLKIAKIPFNFSQVMAWAQIRGQEPINKLYPDLAYMGAYAGWSWGVSRLIDGLELVADDLPIDLSHLAVTGCSFAGKMALYAGAFDERIALTIPQESGGGGGAAWRVGETIGNVEKIGNTSRVWFMASLADFSAQNVSKLPFDHHELMAMVAPRALLFIGNPSQEWLGEESGYVSSRAAHQVWKNFGVGDRFGFTFNADHGHCAYPTIQYPELYDFLEKFLLGDNTVNTNVEIHEFDDVDYERWFEWWGNGESYFPEQFIGEIFTFEAECASRGYDWMNGTDLDASNEAFAVARQNENLTDKDLISEASYMEVSFKVDSTSDFLVYGRVNCASKDEDSFFKRMDDEDFKLSSNLVTDGWEWKLLGNYRLEEGDHTFYLSRRETGAKIDKIAIGSYLYYEPEGIGTIAENACDPKVGINYSESINGFALSQNYPNPFSEKTTISFEIPNETFVSLIITNVLGAEIIELAGKDYSQGKHSIEFDSNHLSNGVYFYTIRTDDFFSGRKMIIKEVD